MNAIQRIRKSVRHREAGEWNHRHAAPFGVIWDKNPSGHLVGHDGGEVVLRDNVVVWYGSCCCGKRVYRLFTEERGLYNATVQDEEDWI